ncbi:MAG: DUF4430 domain-containing protein [Lachnospiraceae bacterium]|nr:DUF4430 domain-containing protein [Lachnospiraceae bacterium]MDD6304586.1 DUF4430 domain-containing protein [Lachnospiraceae bacterium]
MEKKQSDRKKIIIGAVILIVLLAAFAVIYAVFGPKATQGSKEYILKVVDDNGETTEYTGHTDAEYLRGALEELEKADDLTIEGEESDYGLFIDTVNGVTADYSKDKAYWALYVNGEYGNYGVDSQPVTDGDTYSLVYEIVK